MILRINEDELKYLRGRISKELEAFNYLPIEDRDVWGPEYEIVKNLEARFVALERIRINNNTPQAKIIRTRTI